MNQSSSQNSSTWKWVLIGCLGTILITIIAVCGIGYYIYLQGLELARTAGAEIVRVASNDLIEESKLPVEQKEAMKVQIDRVADGVKSGDITFEQLGQIMENLTNSPAITAIPVQVVRYAYLENSGLTDEEKAEATKQMQRVMRGVFEKTIENYELDPVMETIATKGPEGNWEFKEQVTDEELKSFSAACKELADQKEIPDENFEVDLAEELKGAIDDALSGT